MDREIGAQTALCPTCGSQLKAVDQPDGGVAHEPCSTCYGTQATSKQTQQLHEPQRASQATVLRETGTNVDDTEE